MKRILFLAAATALLVSACNKAEKTVGDDTAKAVIESTDSSKSVDTTKAEDSTKVEAETKS